MPDQHPQNQPEPKPKQDWHEVSVQEIEKTLNSAADLAYELAGNVGISAGEPKFRDESGLESVETALDVELKQLDHLVSRTKEELGAAPPARESTAPVSAIPDFMSEFLTEEPASVAPEARAFAEAAGEKDTSTDSGPDGSPVSAESRVERRPHSAGAAKPGLIGVGSLGRRETQKSAKQEKSTTQEQSPPEPRAKWTRPLEKPVYIACDVAIHLLEIMDRPFTNLSPTTRRALSVTAIAAFCMCVLMFLLSLLFA